MKFQPWLNFNLWKIVGQFGYKFLSYLRILTGKKHPKIKLQHLRKIRIWTFGSLVDQIF